MRSAIISMAKKHGLDPAIVYGVCMTESSMNPQAVRYEPHYRYLFYPEKVKPTTCSYDTERILQKMSIGLMQVMGAVYREMGFTGWLTDTIGNPFAQLDYGCRHLAAKIKKYGPELGILSYNSGSPKAGAAVKDQPNYEYLVKVTRFSREW